MSRRTNRPSTHPMNRPWNHRMSHPRSHPRNRRTSHPRNRQNCRQTSHPNCHPTHRRSYRQTSHPSCHLTNHPNCHPTSHRSFPVALRSRQALCPGTQLRHRCEQQIQFFGLCVAAVSCFFSRIVHLEPKQGAEFPPKGSHSTMIRARSGLRNRISDKSSGLQGCSRLLPAIRL